MNPSGPRVLIVSNMWPGQGSAYFGIFVERQVAALRAAAPGWTFDVFLVAAARGRTDYLAAVPRLRRTLRESYDLVHAHYGLTGVTAALAGARPLVLTLHGTDVAIPWQRVLTRFAARRAERVIAVSEYLRADFGDESLPILSCGVPTDHFRLRDRREARSRLGLAQDRIVVLFPADPDLSSPHERRRKNYPLFLEALSLLPAELRDRIVPTALRNVPPPEAPWHMSAADVVVLTSLHESGPLVVKEAIACGTRVVAADVGDVRETLADAPGTAVTSHDPAEIAAAIERVLGTKDDPDAAEARRRRVFECGLDDASIARRLLSLYADVIAR